MRVLPVEVMVPHTLRMPPDTKEDVRMTLTELRTLLKVHGYATNEPIDRVDLKREHGDVVGAEVMFTSGDVAYLSCPAN
jgi:hypothetical protein